MLLFEGLCKDNTEATFVKHVGCCKGVQDIHDLPVTRLCGARGWCSEVGVWGVGLDFPDCVMSCVLLRTVGGCNCCRSWIGDGLRVVLFRRFGVMRLAGYVGIAFTCAR